MRFGIEVNGVLRDTLNKIEQVYSKFYLDNPLITEEEKSQYEILSTLESLDISKHLKFKDDDELYQFLYTEHCMEIFGHAPSTEMSTFNDLFDFYLENRDKHEILIVSDEIGKSKPATLFFLSKFGCQIEKVKFYSQLTINSMWDEVDVLLTANPELLLKYPKDKKIIKFNSTYNKDIETEYSVSFLKQLNEVINKL